MKKTRNRKRTALFAVMLVVAAAAAGVYVKRKPAEETSTLVKTRIETGDIRETVETAGTVRPQNRLEVKPPIAGRIDSLLVKEGDQVKRGDTIAWLSSTERAAMLDAARARGEEELDYWKEIYKSTRLTAPITGEVIVRNLEPGQSVGPNTAVVVLSDRLIVEASVDETDIGSVKVGQSAEIALDAYPGVQIAARVGHISYESTVINNVTIYKVELIADKVPEVFRSGMSAAATIVVKQKKDVVLVPLEAVTQEKGEAFVLLPGGPQDKGTRKRIALGLSDDTNAEVLAGLKAGDTIATHKTDFSLSDGESNVNNPFMPFRKRTSKTKKHK